MSVPLLPALTWALALAVVAWPIHRWILTRVQRPNVAAGLSLLVVTLILVIPLAILVTQLGHEARATVERVRHTSEEGGIRAKLAETNPRLTPVIDWLIDNVDLAAETRHLAEALTGGAANLARGSMEAVLQTLVMLFALFYFFRDRDSFMGEVHSLAPLSRLETERLRKRVHDTVEATLYGRLLMAAIQGALGGLMFWWLGLPAPILWGVVMAVLSVLPMLGTFVIWVPVAIFLAVQGEWGKAMILTAWGTLVIAMVDNILYPIMVGDRLQLHSLVVFVSLVGGIAVFGGAGVVLGPVVAALTDGLLDLWRKPAEEQLNVPGSLLVAP
jgi:predicted PurR-regulated permease PerM